MKFDPRAFLEKHGSEATPRATHATCATQHPETASHVAQVAHVAPPPPPEPENGLPAIPPPALDSAAQPVSAFHQSVSQALPPRIAAAVRAAFEDYDATNNPFDARAWA